MASDWLRHIRLLLWNRWAEFKETWQEARFQCPLLRLCFSDRSEKQDGCPGLWFAETFSTSSLNPLNGIQRNLIGSKILTLTKFVFFFRADRKNKMATLASDWLRHFRLLLWNHLTEFKETWHEARSQRLLPSLCFSGRWVNKNCRPGRSVKKVAHCTQVHDMWPFGPLVCICECVYFAYAIFFSPEEGTGCLENLRLFNLQCHYFVLYNHTHVYMSSFGGKE